MKRWIALVATVCAGAVVATAGAAPPAAVHRDPVGTPMFAAWYTENPGGWFVIDADGALSGPNYGAVAAGVPVMIDVAWVGQSYGHTKALPDVDQLKLTITKGDATIVQQTWAEGRAAWTPVFTWDDYWVDLLGPAPPFNPSMGTGTYGIKWENVFTGLTPGVYDVRIDERFVHTYNDLSLYPDWGARPVRFMPYSASYEFSIVVT